MRKITALTAPLAAAVLVGGCAGIQEMHATHMAHMAEMMGMSSHTDATHAQMAQNIANAQTRADHEGLAQSFEQEAKTAQDKAAEYRHLAQTYTSGSDDGRLRVSPPLDPSGDCQALASLYDQVAAQNRALAGVHRQLASEAKD